MTVKYKWFASSVGLLVTAESLVLAYYRHQICNPSITQAFREFNEQRRQHNAAFLPEELIREIEGFLRAKADRYAHNKLKRLNEKKVEQRMETLVELINVTISGFLTQEFRVACTPPRYPVGRIQDLDPCHLFLPGRVRTINHVPGWTHMSVDAAEERELMEATRGNKELFALVAWTLAAYDPDLVISSEDTQTISKAVQGMELQVAFGENDLVVEAGIAEDEDDTDRVDHFRRAAERRELMFEDDDDEDEWSTDDEDMWSTDDGDEDEDDGGLESGPGDVDFCTCGHGHEPLCSCEDGDGSEDENMDQDGSANDDEDGDEHEDEDDDEDMDEDHDSDDPDADRWPCCKWTFSEIAGEGKVWTPRELIFGTYDYEELHGYRCPEYAR